MNCITGHFDQTGQTFQKCGFARTILAEKRVDFARHHIEIDAIIGKHPGKTLGNAFQVKPWRRSSLGRSGAYQRLNPLFAPTIRVGRSKRYMRILRRATEGPGFDHRLEQIVADQMYIVHQRLQH